MMDPFLSPRSPELTSAQILQLEAVAKALAKARGLHRSARLAGNLSSTNKGHGIELHEVRPYDVSDEVRHIDWRVTARTGMPHTRVYTEEVEHRTLILLSLSPEAYFGTRTTFISTRLVQLAAICAWRNRIQRQRVGFAGNLNGSFTLMPQIQNWQIFSEQLAQMTQLSQRQQQSAPFLIPRLPQLKGFSVIILSDQLTMDDTSKAHLQRLARHNRLHWVSLEDPNTFSLPDGDYVLGGHIDQARVQISKAQQSEAQQNCLALSQQHARLLTELDIAHFSFDVNDTPAQLAAELLRYGVLH